MPARWFVPIEGLDPARVRAHHLHAAVTRWFDQDEASHSAGDKPYTVSPVADNPFRRKGGVGIEVATLTDVAEALFKAATASGSRIRVGNQVRRVGPARLMQQDTWAQLTAGPDESRWRLQFETPVTFRSGNRSTPLPVPGTILHGLARSWRAWSPLPLENLSAATQSGWVSDLDLRSVVVEVPIPGKDGATREVVVSGSLGSLTIRCDSPDLRPTVGALLRLATYAGVGAMTLRGLGVTRVRAGGDEYNRKAVVRGGRAG